MIRRPIFLAFSCLLCGAAIAFLAYRPATIAGIHGDELQSSIQRVAPGLRIRPCAQLQGERWGCPPLRVRTRSFGCWTAVRPHGAGRALAGCISGLDYVSPASPRSRD